MAISMGAALLGSAVIGGIGSAVGASSNSRAINRATEATTQSNAEANRIALEARNQNVTMQQPFYNTGLAANNRINALLGLNVPQQQQPTYSSGGFGASGNMGAFGGMNDFNGQGIPYNMGYNPGVDQNYIGGPMGGGMGGAQAAQPNDMQAAQQGFSDWRNNTGYQFRFNEGIRAIDAGAPVRNSGATLKARERFGQDIGSAEFYNHLGALTGQQQVGTGAANALSGVQSNYANNATQIAQMQGQNLANSAIARANNTNALIGGVTSSFGNAVGMYGSNKGWW